MSVLYYSQSNDKSRTNLLPEGYMQNDKNVTRNLQKLTYRKTVSANFAAVNQ